ncbi:glycoside hydrolase family 35 protein [Stackebrandtia nassauensis]|uniref:Beta-galactosidase n=1 Tax=Stackebrandtia nassauensis (strain DSM 44728 / CIP 108903 / NRRL B-16338 / NBRC 102104 / LLR-40K-21) TaxID=446470 RepID=D3QA48_STANL|nr:beta-galactosidase [Stackebrandtia nassauensis]ADD40760.1 Beta-galactosidase [Stackebrandtia nassauensis DSM 44728]
MLGTDDFLRADRIVVSGAVHYARVLPQQWPHRLRMLRALGATCVETYVPWNLHERRRGEFDFSGIADLERFLTDAAEAGLAAIVRPGPYICAEWENGGLPVWLRANDRHAPLRCSEPRFLTAVDEWYSVLVPKIAAHQVDRGGNVIAVQIENEYGSYGSDPVYLRHLADTLTKHGITVPLFTSDGPAKWYLVGGTIEGALATANFGSRPAEAFAELEQHRPGEAKWCMEYWNGWFDHWGERHHVRDAADAAATLDAMLASGASVNLYMAHGGTNFGTWAGANQEDGFQPTITSYDYDAPISESGAATPKYHAMREVIAKYLPVPDDIPAPAPILAPATVELTERLPLLSTIDYENGVTTPIPSTFEELGLDNGLVLYRHHLNGPRDTQPLTAEGLADRAQVFVDGHEAATWWRNDDNSLDLATGPDGVQLDLLVESMGRVNFGRHVGEPKGLTEGVNHNRQFLHGWTAYPIGLDDIANLPWGREAEAEGPAFYRGRLTVPEPADGFVALPGWTKGYVWVNGFCLGRYWNIGPQETLYLPWPLLNAGDNEIVVLELHPGDANTIEVRDRPTLGEPGGWRPE